MSLPVDFAKLTAGLAPIKDLTIDNITDNVKLINSRTPNPRLKYLLEELVQHVHDFARGTRLSFDEWIAGLAYLVEVGQISTDVRHEGILLSDIFGLSLLVDAIHHPKPPNSTEGTLLGPFHSDEVLQKQNGDSISHDPDGEPLLVLCDVKDTAGKPIPGVLVDVWETDSKGFYDVQYSDRDGPDQRAVLTTNEAGTFYFKAIVPVPYPIPHDGPVGKLLLKLNRHWYRPSHMHFMFKKAGYDPLITALYLRGDPFEYSDAVFGVKSSLVIDLGTVSKEQAEKYGVKEGEKLLTYNFVLVTEEETTALRNEEASKVMKAQGRRMKFYEGLPIPDVD